ncbi:MAG: CheB methylesterase domain-containing protein, partial [Pseudomonadota bacterium]
SHLVSCLDADLPCPILIVQHLSVGFVDSLAEQLGRRTSLKVYAAKNQDVPKAGEIFVCPGGLHMKIKRNRFPQKGGLFEICLDESALVNDFRPSVDVLFSSIADHTHNNVLAVVMTGIGYDGAKGAEDLVKRAGGYVIIQDKESSVVWGMPESVALLGVVSEIVPLELLGQRISRLVKGKAATNDS